MLWVYMVGVLVTGIVAVALLVVLRDRRRWGGTRDRSASTAAELEAAKGRVEGKLGEMSHWGGGT